MSYENMMFSVMNDEKKMIFLFMSDETIMYRILSDLNK